MIKQMRKLSRGFTIFELLLVLAIIAIIASALWVSLGSSRIKARNGRIQTNIANIKAIIEANFSPSEGFADLNTCAGGGVCTRNTNGPGNDNIAVLEDDIKKLQGSALPLVTYFTTPYIAGSIPTGYSIYAYFYSNEGGTTSDTNNGGYVCYSSNGNNKIVTDANSAIPNDSNLPNNNDACQ